MSWLDHGLPFGFAVFLWWFATGAILWLDQRPRASHGWSLAGMSLLGLLGLVGVAGTAGSADPLAAYLAFLSALAVWGWHELAFLMGVLTGPVRGPCPPGAGHWTRFKGALGAIAYHEAALALTLPLILGLTWGQPNQVGAGAFVILFVMRISAKLNVFVGAPNLTEEFIPAHLSYLKSYFGRSEFNPLLPVCVAVATIGAWRLGVGALSSGSSFEAVGYTLLLALLALAILEHLFLVLPVQDQALWRWALRSAREHSAKRLAAAGSID